MQYLTIEELKKLLDCVKGDRRKLLVKVAFWHGLRASEAISLTGADIQNGYVRVKRLKGSLTTNQPYVKHADLELDEAAELEDLAAALKPKERLFDMERHGFYQLMRRAGAEAGLPPHKRHPHILKHTCAKIAIKSGIENCKQYLGHKSLSSTGAYLRVNDDEASSAFAAVLGGGK